MYHERTRMPGPWLLGVLLVAVTLTVASPAAAATAPTMTGPKTGTSATTGTSLSVTWSGSLQGDAGTLARSNFRVEIGRESTLPSSPTTTWLDATSFAITTPGQSVTSLDIGIPETAGDYVVRVCAWGVATIATEDVVSQLACSATAQIKVQVASSSTGSSETVVINNEKRVKEADKVVTRPAPDTATPTTPTTSIPELEDEPAPIQVTTRVKETVSDITSPVADMADVQIAPAKEEKFGVSSVGTGIVSGLGWKLPGIGVPFWTLLLLVAPIVSARWFRRAAFGMFDLEVDDVEDELEDLEDDDDLPVIADEEAA